MSQLTQLGDNGYVKCMMQDWDGAIAIWDEGIKRYPTEKRFYNNRSYCHLQKRDYKRALADAAHLTANFPDYARGHFRKGEILAALGKPKDAESAFQQVLTLEPTSEEASREIKEMQIRQLLGLGFSRYQAGNALELATSLEQAKVILRAGAIPDADEAFYLSDDDESCVPATHDPFTDPSNPRRCVSMWIGNITEKITDAELEKAFSRFGRVKSGKVYASGINPPGYNVGAFYAFVNFVDPDSASRAMRELQGRELCRNKNILLRWPDKDMGIDLFSSKVNRKGAQEKSSRRMLLLQFDMSREISLLQITNPNSIGVKISDESVKQDDYGVEINMITQKVAPLPTLTLFYKHITE